MHPQDKLPPLLSDPPVTLPVFPQSQTHSHVVTEAPHANDLFAPCFWTVHLENLFPVKSMNFMYIKYVA